MTETAEIQQKIKEIKQSFHQLMDGAVAQSMRQKGLDYHLNWGVTLPRLREMANEIKESWPASNPLINSQSQKASPSGGRMEGASLSPLSSLHSPLYDLSLSLWKENVRECKILATMLMPAEEMLPEVVDIWMEQTDTVELAEQAAFNLYQHLPFAAEKAFLWLSSADDLPQICGYHILSRLFAQGQEPNERGINEFIDQALAAMQGPNPVLRKAAMQSLIHFSSLGLMYERLARSATHSIGMDII